jgi:hypothetical protein
MGNAKNPVKTAAISKNRGVFIGSFLVCGGTRPRILLKKRLKGLNTIGGRKFYPGETLELAVLRIRIWRDAAVPPFREKHEKRQRLNFQNQFSVLSSRFSA